MAISPVIDELRLRRFARLVAPLLGGTALQGVGPRAARDRPGAGLEFLDLRDYAAGEDVRHIDWRQSARHQRLLLRRFRDEAASDWLLCVDGSASTSLGRKWLMLAELGVALAYALISAGHRVSVAIFAERIVAWYPLGRGQSAFAAISRQLLGHRPAPRGGSSLPGLCAAHAPRSGNLVVLSDFLREDAMADDLRLLRASVASASAIQVLGERDAAADARGPSVLFDIESAAEVRQDVDDQSVVTANDALEQHQSRLRVVCASLGIPFTPCRDGDNWEQVLLAHLRG